MNYDDFFILGQRWDIVGVGNFLFHEEFWVPRRRKRRRSQCDILPEKVRMWDILTKRGRNSKSKIKLINFFNVFIHRSNDLFKLI